MSNSTTIKSLNEMALTDLVLPHMALDNIIEEDELELKLSNYVTTLQLDNAVSELRTTIEDDYATFASVKLLTDRVEELERIVQQLASTQQDGGQSLNSDVNLPSDIITINNENSTQTEQTESETQPVEFQFTGMKSTSTVDNDANTIRVGEDIILYGKNLKSQTGIHRLYAQRIRANEEDEMLLLDSDVWLNDDWSNFTNDSIQLPSAVWNLAPFTDLIIGDNVGLFYVKMQQLPDSQELVQESSISILAEVVAPAQPAMATAPRKRRKAK